MICPVCAGPASSARDVPSFRDDAIDISYAFCEDCGLGFQVPMPDAEKVDAFYRKDHYRKLLQKGEVITSHALHGQATRASRIVPYIQERLPSVRFHLDVGSCAGVLCDAVQRAYGATTQGVELSEGFLAYSNAQGILTSATWPNGNSRFDLITIVHTLEHVVDPVSMLRKARAVGTGHLYAEVPFEQADIVHPYIFNERAFDRLLRVAGWELESVELIEDSLFSKANRNIVAWAH